MEAIYEEMLQRNVQHLRHHLWQADPMLNLPEEDQRRCIAVVAEGQWTWGDSWSKIEGFVEGAVAGGLFITPQLHHTILCLRPWKHKGDFDSEGEQRAFEKAADELAEQLQHQPYRICFDRVVPVRTGFTLCGTTDVDLNRVRDHMRKQGHVEGERYHLDIHHATLLRCVREPTATEQQQLLAKWQTDLPETAAFAEFEVRSFRICEASWCMRPGEYKNFLYKELQPPASSL